MKHLTRYTASLLTSALFLFIGSGSIHAQAQPGARSADNIWQVAGDAPAGLAPRTDITGTFATVLLNKDAFDARLAGAPREDDPNAGRGVEMTLPMSDGTFARFSVLESPMLAPELAAAFPQIRTYRAQGIDDPTATARFGWTDLGFHSIVISQAGTTYVDPYSKGNLDYYIAYGKQPRQPWVDMVDGEEELLRVVNEFPIVNGATLRTYRLALAATTEYTVAAGGTKPQALARMTTSMNRVNGIYERELAVRMTLSTGTPGDPTALIYAAEPDPYTNNNGSTMLGQNQTNLDTVIGSANYDVGHVFSTGGGGVASLGVPCNNSFKARGVTGLPNPVGDAFDVDFVAHEMGHQFGGHHPFNGQSGNCSGGNRSAANAVEVGSGSTIMAYAGICSVEDLQLHSDDIFHFESLNEMTAFLTTGGGQTCGTTSATGNTPPTVTAPGNFTIPRNTPFALNAAGADANGDALTYAWEEYDLGTASTSVLSASTDDGSRPLLRAYTPTTSSLRTFPSLPFILNNANVPPQTYTCVGGGTCLTGEVLPATSRAMKFQVTTRDNRAGGGGIGTALSTVTIDSASGPFVVTSQSTAVSYVGGSTQTVTWNTAGSNVPPVNATNVKISLSTDGGNTFPTVILASTPNDGSEAVGIPNSVTTTARIKVEAVGNIFFDINDANFTITAGTDPPPPPPPPPSVGAPTNFAVSSKSGNSVTFTWIPGTGTLPITNYLIEGGVIPGQALANLALPTTGGTFTLTLPTGAFYLRLYAQSNGTTSAVSNEIRVFVNVPEPPAAPTNLLGLVNGSTLGLSWIVNTSGGTPTSMILDVSGTLSGSVPVPVGETFSAGGVPPGTYTISVRAANATGPSASSAPVTLTFPGPCSGAPLAPVFFTLSKSGSTLSLSWLPPATGPAATSYVLLVSGAFNGTVPVGALRAVSGGVGPGSYTVSVAAVNSCGTGPATAPQTVVVP